MFDVDIELIEEYEFIIDGFYLIVRGEEKEIIYVWDKFRLISSFDVCLFDGMKFVRKEYCKEYFGSYNKDVMLYRIVNDIGFTGYRRKGFLDLFRSYEDNEHIIWLLVHYGWSLHHYFGGSDRVEDILFYREYFRLRNNDRWVVKSYNVLGMEMY